jgi:N-methylhydantoinase A
VADLRHDFVRTLNRPLDHVNIETVQAILAEQEAEGRRLIGQEKITLTGIRAEYSADMQFVGQTHLLRVPLPSANPSRDEMQRLFEAAYHARFRVDLPSIKANLVNLNVSVIGMRPDFDLSALIDPVSRKDRAEPMASRQVWFGGWVETPVYWRDHLPLDLHLTGPAIIEQMDTTTIIEPGCVVTSDRDGNLIVTVPQ